MPNEWTIVEMSEGNRGMQKVKKGPIATDIMKNNNKIPELIAIGPTEKINILKILLDFFTVRTSFCELAKRNEQNTTVIKKRCGIISENNKLKNEGFLKSDANLSPAFPNIFFLLEPVT
ncbi:hypothetical protein WICPIJ_003352 [Wickerhamomyces pijperi]|uniref:Uncharacterized protein n=1 Tax=Wickerhamomyces pijperi TaxID=599730 RepID=A0A9P8TN30_WICPI|nr:hypothetical protein WICPIJ_003352 [Wickerhamomyces pijperi]